MSDEEEESFEKPLSLDQIQDMKERENQQTGVEGGRQVDDREIELRENEKTIVKMKCEERKRTKSESTMKESGEGKETKEARGKGGANMQRDEKETKEYCEEKETREDKEDKELEVKNHQISNGKFVDGSCDLFDNEFESDQDCDKIVPYLYNSDCNKETQMVCDNISNSSQRYSQGSSAYCAVGLEKEKLEEKNEHLELRKDVNNANLDVEDFSQNDSQGFTVSFTVQREEGSNDDSQGHNGSGREVVFERVRNKGVDKNSISEKNKKSGIPDVDMLFDSENSTDDDKFHDSAIFHNTNENEIINHKNNRSHIQNGQITDSQIDVMMTEDTQSYDADNVCDLTISSGETLSPTDAGPHKSVSSSGTVLSVKSYHGDELDLTVSSGESVSHGETPLDISGSKSCRTQSPQSSSNGKGSSSKGSRTASDYTPVVTVEDYASDSDVTLPPTPMKNRQSFESDSDITLPPTPLKNGQNFHDHDDLSRSPRSSQGYKQTNIMNYLSPPKGSNSPMACSPCSDTVHSPSIIKRLKKSTSGRWLNSGHKHIVVIDDDRVKRKEKSRRVIDLTQSDEDE